ncbi:hypothetical protein AQ810_25230 [Burkholderia pseudomallei]|nr:hypothetical protein AQ810_25230 [Burkholderia pseudomallei]
MIWRIKLHSDERFWITANGIEKRGDVRLKSFSALILDHACDDLIRFAMADKLDQFKTFVVYDSSCELRTCRCSGMKVARTVPHSEQPTSASIIVAAQRLVVVIPTDETAQRVDGRHTRIEQIEKFCLESIRVRNDNVNQRTDDRRNSRAGLNRPCCRGIPAPACTQIND